MQTIEISKIDWGTRARKEYKEIDELAFSISNIGLICPIAIEEPNMLRAGGRRLTAVIQLGWKSIPCVFFKDLSEIDQLLIELEENLQRDDLTWQEEVSLKKKLNDAKKREAKLKGEKWTRDDSAKIFKVSGRNVDREIELAKAIERSPELAKEKDKTTAQTKLRRMKESTKRSLDVSTVDINDQLHNGDAIEEMMKLDDNSVDLILFDPPFAENYDKKAEEAGWSNVYGDVDDDEATIFPLVAGVLKESYRVLKEGAHMYMFFSLRPRKFHELAMFIVDAQLRFQEQPLFWVKPSNQNFDPYHRYTVNYEPFIFISKGKPRDLKAQSNSTFSFAPPSDKKHPAEKPAELYAALTWLSTQEGEIVLDPTAGSGMSLVAAKSLKRKVIGIEKDKGWYDLIKINLSKVKGE